MFKKILPGLVAVIIVLGVGIFIGTKLPRKIETPTGDRNDSFQAGWDAARERLKQSPLGMATLEKNDVRDVNGKILKIVGNKIIVKINPLEPLTDPNLDERIIVIDSNTKIVATSRREDPKFLQEQQAFQEKMKQQLEQRRQDPSVELEQIIPPMLGEIIFDKKDVALEELKEDMDISVTSAENIKEVKEFTAVRIDMQEIMPINPMSLPVAPAAVSSDVPMIVK